VPKNHRDFWIAKLTATKERDNRNHIALEQAGWKIIIIWECLIEKDLESAVKPLMSALQPPDFLC